MSTLFTEIYCQNEIIKEYSKLRNLTENQKYSLYFGYLKYSISYFQYDSYPDITDIIPFSQEEYYYISDGIDKDFLLSPVPSLDCEFYVGYKNPEDLYYTQVFDYSFDSNTNILTINDPVIPENYEIYISGYIIGQFNETLNFLEVSILSEGMLVPWDQMNMNKDSLLNQMIYAGSSKMYSQANHIEKVLNVANNQYFKIVKGMISEYSYKANPNGMKGLGGGLV